MQPMAGTSATYLGHLHARGFSPNTIYNRHRAIVRFRLATGCDPLEMTEDRMIGWWIGLHLTPSSRAGELAAIRGYCRWAVKHGFILADPTRLIDRPRLPRRVPRPIDESSLNHALATAVPDVRAILCLAAYGGLRAAEIAALEWSDVRKDTLLINGKGGRQRVIPAHPMITAALTGLPGIRRRGPVLRRRDLNLGRVAPYLVCNWANTHLHDVGIPETLHQLRHRFCSQVYQLSRDLRLCQELMGHASPVTTAGYAQWDRRQAAAVTALLPIPA